MSDPVLRSRGHRWRAYLFRRTVLAYLTGSGLQGLTMRDTTSRPTLNDVFPERSDVQGLRDWCVLTRVDLTYNLSEAMDEAVKAAEIDDKRFPLVVQARKGRDAVEDSYVVTTLSAWAEVVALMEDRN